MKRAVDYLLRVCFIGLIACLTLPAHAAISPLPVCSWPFESDGQGLTNVATPDTHATYWVMPLDTNRWKSMVVNARYPHARFFNYATYSATGALIDTIYDAQIAPNGTGTNPFVNPPANGGDSDYSVTIGSAAGSNNSLRGGVSGLIFIVYRVYLPNAGSDRTGGVGVPAATLTDFAGNARPLQPCPFANAETSLGSLIVLLRAGGFSDAANFLGKILALANTPPLGTCSQNQGSPAPVTFTTSVPGANFFPNPQTTYFQTANLCFQPNQILVVRGKAPVFPSTYSGGSLFQPAFDDRIQLRYWSMCNNVGVLPYPAVACQADAMTKLDQAQFYTYVISNDPAPPSWLPAAVTWLPWGPTRFPITLILRNILPADDFTAADYVPVGVFCSQTRFTMQGWQGCVAAAGMDGKAP